MKETLRENKESQDGEVVNEHKKRQKSEEKCRLIKQERGKENLLLVCTESSMSSDKKLYQSREFGHFEFKQV